MRTTPRAPLHPLTTKVWVLTGVVAVADFVFGATFVTFMGQQGLNAAAIGLLLSIPAVTSVLVEAPSGAWGDRFGHRKLVLGGLLTWGAGLVVFAAADTPVVFGIAILFWATGLALYSGAATALLVNTLSADGLRTDGDTALRGTELIRWLAAAGGAAVVAGTAWAVSTGISILISGILLLAAGVWVAATWPESPTRSHLPVGRSLLRGVRLVFASSSRSLVAFSVLASVDLAIVILTWQPMTIEVVGLDRASLGVVLLVLSLGTAAGAWTTRWLRRFDPGLVLVVSLVALNGALVVALLGSPAVGAIYLAAEVLLGVALTTLAVWAQRTFPDRLRATATSVLGTVTGVTIAATNAFVGPLWERIGLTGAVAVSGAVLLTITAGIGCATLANRARLRWRARDGEARRTP